MSATSWLAMAKRMASCWLSLSVGFRHAICACSASSRIGVGEDDPNSTCVRVLCSDGCIFCNFDMV